MNRKAFRHLLKRYLNNTCTDDEKRIVDQWYELLDNSKIALSDQDVKEVEARLWNKIRSSTDNFKVETEIAEPKKHIFRISYIAAAASFAGVCLILFIWLSSKKKQSQNLMAGSPSVEVERQVRKGFLQLANNSDTMQNFVLEDGSSVAIYPGAKLAYPKHFALERREVYLDGDASFDISKNPNRPFFVFNNQIVTQVLGTSFTIRKKNNQLEVNVKTGKVAVYENKDRISLSPAQQKSNGVIITPNQKVIYHQEERYFVTTVVEEPLPVPKENNIENQEIDFDFNETPVSKVLSALESTYQLEIVLENEKLRDCLFTGDLRKQNLFSCLESICVSFNASYEIKGTKLLLKGGSSKCI
jgi:transmembrane sensor